jgi:circadian clock protein KaiB
MRSQGDEPSQPAREASSIEAFERLLAADQRIVYTLVLYIAGTAAHSQRALRNIKKLCEDHLADCHSLEVVDIYQQPELAEAADIVVVPTLVKKAPPPVRHFVGDMTRTQQVLDGLGIRAERGQP